MKKKIWPTMLVIITAVCFILGGCSVEGILSLGEVSSEDTFIEEISVEVSEEEYTNEENVENDLEISTSEENGEVPSEKQEAEYSILHVFMLQMRSQTDEKGNILFRGHDVMDEQHHILSWGEYQDEPVLFDYTLDTDFDNVNVKKTIQDSALSEETYNLIYELESKVRGNYQMPIGVQQDVIHDPTKALRVNISTEEEIVALLGNNIYTIQVDDQLYAWKIYNIYLEADSTKEDGEWFCDCKVNIMGYVLRIPTDVEAP